MLLSPSGYPNSDWRLAALAHSKGMDAANLFYDRAETVTLAPENDLQCREIDVAEYIERIECGGGKKGSQTEVEIVLSPRLLPPYIDPIIEVFKIVSHARLLNGGTCVGYAKTSTKRFTLRTKLTPLPPERLGQIRNGVEKVLNGDPEVYQRSTFGRGVALPVRYALSRGLRTPTVGRAQNAHRVFQSGRGVQRYVALEGHLALEGPKKRSVHKGEPFTTSEFRNPLGPGRRPPRLRSSIPTGRSPCAAPALRTPARSGRARW